MDVSPVYLPYMVNGHWPRRINFHHRYIDVVTPAVSLQTAGVNKTPKKATHADGLIRHAASVGGVRGSRTHLPPLVTSHNGFEVR